MAKFITPPLSGSNFINLIKLFIRNKVDLKYFPKALYILLISLSGTPFRVYEKLKTSPKVNNENIEQPPIFIIGHWRSGTTHLHHLMVLNKNLGYMTSFQSFFPEIFLATEKHWKSILKPLWISQRLQDNVSYGPDIPEEEEYALGNVSDYSFYHGGFFFPKNMLDYFHKYVLFKGVAEEEVAKYKAEYLRIIKKLSLHCNRQQLVLKNPSNTGRIKILLKLFPDAKFIHIYRNPYLVYASTKNLYSKAVPPCTFHNINEKQIESNILNIYQQLMQAYFNDRQLIPPENLMEIKYEDLIGNEIEFMGKIYKKFNISYCETSKNKLKEYLSANSSYQTNKYLLDRETQKKIYKNWKFAIDTWNYTI